MKCCHRLGMFVVLSSLILLSACATSRRVNFLDVPVADVAPSELPDVAAYQAKYGQYDGVILFNEDVHEHSGAREKGFLDTINWHYSRIHRERYLVFDPTDQVLTSCHIYGHPARFYARLVAPDGSSRNFGPEDLKPEFDEDGDERQVLVFPDIENGTLVDLGWELDWKIGYAPPPLSHDVALQFRYPCERATFTYAYPDWWTLDIKHIREGYELPLTVTSDEKNKKITMHYEARDIPALELEPFAPYFKEQAEYLQFQVGDLVMGGMSLDRPKAWDALADKFQRNIIEHAGKNREYLHEQTSRITADCTTDVDRVRAILAFVRDHVTVTREGRDGDYRKVCEEGSGNVFDVVGLTQVLIDAAGIEAYLILAHSADDGWFDPDYVSLDQFTVPAVRARIDSEDYVLFPYLKHLPLEHTPRRLQGQMSLIMATTSDRSSWDLGEISEPGAAMLWRIPEGSRAGNNTHSRFDLTLTPAGDLQVRETRSLVGEVAFLMRTALDDLDTDEREKAVKKLLAYSDGEVYLEDYELANLDDPDQPLQITMDYTIDNLVLVTPDEIVLQTGGLLSPLSAADVEMDPKQRRNPIRIAFDENHEKDVTLHYPVGWRVSTDLADVDLANEFGELHGRYEQDPGSLRIHQTVQLHRAAADASHYPALLELAGETSKLQVPAIILRVVATP